MSKLNTNGKELNSYWKLGRRAVILVFIVNGFSFSTIVPHFPWLQKKLELGEALMGVALFFPAIGAVSMMLLTGRLIQRCGSRPLILLGSLLMQISLPLILLMPSLTSMIPLLLLVGAATGMMDVAMNSQAAVLEQAYDRPIMSTFHANWSLGTLFGGASASLMLGLGYTPFEHVALFSVILILLVLACGRWLLHQDEDLPGADVPIVAIPRGPVLALGLLAFLVMISEGAASDWSAIYSRSVLEASPSEAAATFTVFTFTMTLGRFTGDRMVQLIGRPRMLRYSSAVGAFGFSVGLYSETLEGAMFGFAVLGLGLANTVPILISRASRIRGVSPAQGIAGVATMGYFGFLIGPPLIGTFAELLGLRLALMLIVVFCGIVALTAIRRSPEADSSGPPSLAC